MAGSVTNQITEQRGQDGSGGERTSTRTSTSTRLAAAVENREQRTSEPVTSTRTEAARTSTVRESSPGQRSTTTEDHAFQITFTVPWPGNLGCEEIAL